MGNKQLSRTGLRVEEVEKGKGLAWPEEGSETDGRGSKRGHQLTGDGRDAEAVVSLETLSRLLVSP